MVRWTVADIPSQEGRLAADGAGGTRRCSGSGSSPDPRRTGIGALLTDSALKDQTEIADLLIANGANVDARDKSGATPLHQAEWKGNLAFATLLSQHGAD